jgi:hypothetical protein
MFELLDLNKDGTVDLQEFISGLSFLCKGTPEEKLLRTSSPPPRHRRRRRQLSLLARQFMR